MRQNVRSKKKRIPLTLEMVFIEPTVGHVLILTHVHTTLNADRRVWHRDRGSA